METSYWQQLSSGRLSRRKALAAGGGLTLGAAVLAACGSSGSQSSGGSSSNKSSLVVEPVDTLAKAKRGGTMKDRGFADPPTLDIQTANNPWNTPGFCVYSMLVGFKPGYLKPSDNEPIPDLAESWETSPDGLQINMKIRPNIKFHNKAPVNGRTLDMDDVMFSWNRFATKYSGRTTLVNSVDPAAPVLSFTATDSRTISIKLKEPLVYAIALFYNGTSGGPIIIPKETDSTLDLRGDMIGTGPWVLTNYTPSVAFTLKRNPDYWDKDWALVDTVEQPIISEYATALSQLKAGNIYMFGQSGAPQLRAEDILPLKKDEPRINLFKGDYVATGSTQTLGWLPAGKSPFLDERVRQAVSMAIDRDLYIDTVGNVSAYQKEGIPSDFKWSTAINYTNGSSGATSEGWWLDPKGKDFGPNARYFQHDVAEAKKLLAAAGYPKGFETVSNFPGVELPSAAFGVITDGMIAEAGITSKPNKLDYLKDYVPNFRDGHGQFEGWGYMSTAGGVTGGTALGALAIEYWANGGNAFHGFSTNGKNDQSGDPTLNAMFEKARVEQDTEKRRALVFDIQRYLAKAMYAIAAPGAATGLAVAWPALGNYRVWQGIRNNYRWWIDETKPPFKSA
jgi:peptide/nickel transport system substrate-binding protein